MSGLFKHARMIAWLGLLLAGAPAWSADPVPSNAAPEIGGYSPVSYFTERRAEKGSQSFAVAHRGKVYYLTSAEQVAIFSADPERYQPRFEVCSFSLASGQLMAIDPTRFKVVGTTLLLFHRSDDMDGLRGWEESGLTDAQLLARAEKQFLLLEF